MSAVLVYLLAIVALGVLIVLHEAGHMAVARWCGMRVERFSVGFGPVLRRWRLGETTYQIAAIPFGGFVQIAGMNPHENLAPDDPGSFENKSVWARLATIFAGPGINYLAAVVLCGIAFGVWGQPAMEISGRIEAVQKDTPAARAGLASGDKIVAIDGKPVRGPDQVREAVRASGGRALRLEVERGGARRSFSVAPQARSDVPGGWAIGVQFGYTEKWVPVPLWKLPVLAVTWPAERVVFIAQMLGRVIGGEEKAEVGGPVAIVRQLKGEFDSGIRKALMSMVMLNILLAFFNLLPVPALDGGRLAFLLIAAVTRRRVNARLETAVHMVGFVLLLGLILLVTVNDIGNAISGK